MRTAMASHWNSIRLRFARDQRGATAVEYGFIISCIVIVLVIGVHGLGDVTSRMWNDINNKVTHAQ